MIKKLFFAVMAIGMMTACNGSAEGGAEGSKAESSAAEVKGMVYEGDSFTMTLPEGWVDTYKSGTTINAKDESGELTMDATFSDYPCKPDDFKTYATNLSGMSIKKDFKFDEPKIDGNIMTLKAVKDDAVEHNFVVYLDEKAGVAGSFKYPAAKAAEVEPLMMAAIKSIKKK